MMATDKQLREQMAIEERFKKKAGRDDTRGAYREDLAKQMSDPSRFTKRKLKAVKEGAMGVGATLLTPLVMAGEARADFQSRKAKGEKADALESMEAGVRGGLSEAGRSIKGVKQAVSDYRTASREQKEAKREKKKETKMAKGGHVRGSGVAIKGVRQAKII